MVRRLALCALLASLFAAAPAAAGVDRWTPTGPPGGPVERLVADPAHPGHLYAIVDPDELFRTVDGGRRWLPVRTRRPTSERQWVAHVAVAPSRPATVYAAVGGLYEAQPWDGLYRSVDAGSSWERRGDLPVWDVLAVSTGDPEVLFAAGYPDAELSAMVVFRSVDGGAAWQRVLDLPSDAWPHDLVVDPSAAGTVYLATARGLWKSSDGGDTWASASTVVSGEPLGGLVGLAIAPSDPQTVYAIGPSIYRSDDGGTSWRVMAPNPDWCGRRLAVHPRRPETLYLVCSDRLVRSRDGGATWSDLPVGPAGSSPMLWDLAIDPADARILYVATRSQGVYRSRDGGRTWLRVSSGIQRLAVEHLVVDPFAGRTLLAATEGTVGPDGRARRWLWRSEDGGSTWRRWLPGLEEAVERIVPDPRSPGAYFLATGSGLYLRDEPAGALRRVWDRAVSRLAVDGGDPDRLYAVSGSVYRSRNRGRTWQETLPLSSGAWSGQTAIELLPDPGRAGRVYTVVEDWIVGAESSFQLLRSDDGGKSWRSLGWPDSERLHLVPVPGRPSVLYASTFFSVDGGETWQETGFPGPVLLAVPGDPPTLYAQDADHLLRSRDGGSTWVALAGGAGAPGADDLRLDRNQVLVADPAAPERLYRYDGTGIPSGIDRAQVVGAAPIRLQGGRFELRAAWRDAGGLYGGATPAGLSDRAAAFALVGRRKLVAVAELLDRRSVNGHFWALGASLLPVEVTVTVIDRVSGLSEDLAFPRQGAASRVVADALPPLPESPATAGGSTGAAVCGPAKELAFLGGRFRVRVVRRLAPGVDKPVSVAPLRWEAGAACFDDPDVPSVVVQMADGRAIDGSIWVLVGGLSDEAYTVQVRDTVTGAVHSYLHLAGAPASVADLDAF